MARTYADWCEILKGERLPAVVVDLDAFDRNVEKVARVVREARTEGGGSKSLRVATKSIRVPELISRIMKAGSPYQGLMCYSAEEALFLASKGFKDLLVAYPAFQASDLKALREAHDQGSGVSLIVDSLDGIRALDSAMGGVSRPFPVVIDVDLSLRFPGMHIGVRRSPVRSVKQVLELVEETERLDHVRFAGLMGYEAQVAGLGDRNPFKRMMNPAFRLVRSYSARASAKRRGKIAWALAEKKIPVELFNGGGSGSLNISINEPWLTELTAGSAFLASHLFDYYSNISFEPAFFFALQAVRSSDSGYVTCLGGGYIASGEPGWDKQPRPWLPEGAKLIDMEGCGEVQTPVQLPGGVKVPMGGPVLFRHAKAGELAERFDEYLLVSGDKVTGRAKTYRGLGQCYF